MARISRTGSVIRVLALLFLLPVPVFGQKVIPAGYDLWVTVGDGSTVVDFGKDPIPPGVFSEDSEAFTGLVRLRGEPLLTDPPGLLHDTDTIVERLHDAVPDGRPVTVRMTALSLVGASSPWRSATRAASAAGTCGSRWRESSRRAKCGSSPTANPAAGMTRFSVSSSKLRSSTRRRVSP